MVQLNRLYKLAFSCFIFLLYIFIMYIDRDSASIYYQIRIATALYTLAYSFPFLIIPLSTANLASNLFFGSWGITDVIGGFFVGFLVTSLVVLIRKKQLNYLFSAVPIILIPALGVSIWLAPLMKISYTSLAITIGIGQIVSATIGIVILGTTEFCIQKYISHR